MPVNQWVIDVATQAAQWGADQELEAVIDWMIKMGYWGGGVAIPALREARRPKSKTQTEEALEALDRMDQFPTTKDQSVIRRALERLQELEGKE